MSSMRLRRLQSDYEAIRRLAQLHPKIAVEGVSGNPPDRYRLILNVASVKAAQTGSDNAEEIVDITDHKLEIVLPRGYPRDAPSFRMLTPVFHPNIAPHAVCIADHWSAGSTLEHTIQRVGEMLAYQSYNVKSPLNGRAAQWAAEHPERLPTDPHEFFVDLAEAERSLTSMPAMTEVPCNNCGGGDDVAIEPTCAKQHKLCNDCRMHCPQCGEGLCLACGHCAQGHQL